MKKSLWLKRAVIPAMLMLCLAVSGCGVKVWPSPNKREDSFSFKSVNGTRSGGCLTVMVKVSGANQNIADLSLQYQAEGDGPGEGCPTCPFFPANHQEFIPGTDGMQSNGTVYTFSSCGLNPKKSYSWRVVGHNVFDTLGIVVSDVFTAVP